MDEFAPIRTFLLNVGNLAKAPGPFGLLAEVSAGENLHTVLDHHARLEHHVRMNDDVVTQHHTRPNHGELFDGDVFAYRIGFDDGRKHLPSACLPHKHRFTCNKIIYNRAHVTVSATCA